MIQQAKNYFLRETSEHTMKVHRDDGLYRHLEFSNRGSSVYRFDLITWPGYLTICGDMGTWTFSRTADMFEFFGGNFEKSVNPRYWGEKLQMGASGRRDEICMEFDEESSSLGCVSGWQRYSKIAKKMMKTAQALSARSMKSAKKATVTSFKPAKPSMTQTCQANMS